jgi:hypothetical protein
MVFIAIVLGSIGGLMAGIAVTQKAIRTVGTHGQKAKVLTWVTIGAAILPAWFFAFVIGGNFGGGFGAQAAGSLGGNEAAFVVLGIFSGIFICLFTVIATLALMCAAVARLLFN